jgi:cation:H+ antiporter
VVLAVLGAVVMGTQLAKTLIRFRLTPDVALIALMIWVVGLVLTQRAGKTMAWTDSGEAPDSQPSPAGTPRPSMRRPRPARA